MASIARPPCDEGVIRSGKADAPCAPSSGPWVLAATIIGSAMAFIDGTVTNVALPQIQSRLGATAVDAQWIVESYALFLAALILVGGSLGDHYGRRRIYSLGVALFAVASVGCGIAMNPEQLIVARAIQGVGGALLVPGSLSIISASFEGEQRGKAIGTWSGFSGITAALGPVVGGYLVENVSWRAAFLINIPLAIAVLAIVARHVPESRDPDARRLDIPGAVLATLGLGGLVFGLIESQSNGFSDPLVLVALALGAGALVAFVFVERRSHEPMMPLSLFRSRNFSGANLLTLLLYAGLGGSLYFFPFLLIQVHGYSATAAGSAFLPFIVVTFLLSRWAGGLVTRYGARLPLMIGPVIAAAGFALFALPGIGGSYWTTFFPAVFALGLGMSLVIAPLTTTALNSVEGRHSGLASGVNNAVSRTAGLVSLPVLGIFIFFAFSTGLDSRVEPLNLSPEAQGQLEAEKVDLAGAEIPPGLSGEDAAAVERAVDESFLAGFRLSMYVAAGLALASAVAAAILIEGKGRPKPTGESEQTRRAEGPDTAPPSEEKGETRAATSRKQPWGPTVNNNGVRIVVAWHEALNAGDADRLVELSHPDMEMGGPRGRAAGEVARGAEVLRKWLARANIRLEPRRVFHDGDTVVVEEVAEWRSPDTEEIIGSQTVASIFVVRGGRVTSVVRHDDLTSALTAAKLDESYETKLDQGST